MIPADGSGTAVVNASATSGLGSAATPATEMPPSPKFSSDAIVKSLKKSASAQWFAGVISLAASMPGFDEP